MDRLMLEKFIRIFPHQPATAFWRSIEVGEIIKQSFPEGVGLDLGCGDGKLTKLIFELTGQRRLVGLDTDQQELEQARHSGIYERLHFCPAEKIPEADGAFDFVFSNSVLEHIDDISPVIREAARVLKPGGVFLFTVPGNDFQRCLKGPLAPFMTRQRYVENVDRRCEHKRYWNLKDWDEELSRHGMVIETGSRYFEGAEVRRWETITRFTSEFFFALFGGKKTPFEIQRMVGLRRHDIKVPWILAKSLSALLVCGLGKSDSTPSDAYGCLLVKARKKAITAGRLSTVSYSQGDL